jgi:hypothetical protein
VGGSRERGEVIREGAEKGEVRLCAPIVKSRLISSVYCWETLG